jgi:hypothetical protein
MRALYPARHEARGPGPRLRAGEESARATDRLSELRSTTGVYLAATVAVASFLGAKSLETGSFEPFDGLALGALLASVSCGVLAMSPFPDHENEATEGKPVAYVPEEHLYHVKWRGCVPIEQIEILVGEAGGENAHLALAAELQARATRDRHLLDSRWKLVRATGALAAVQLVLWLLALA